MHDPDIHRLHVVHPHGLWQDIFSKFGPHHWRPAMPPTTPNHSRSLSESCGCAARTAAAVAATPQHHPQQQRENNVFLKIKELSFDVCLKEFLLLWIPPCDAAAVPFLFLPPMLFVGV